MAASPTTPSWVIRIPPPIWMLALLLAAYAVQRSFAWAAIPYFRSALLAIVFAVGGIAFASWARQNFVAVGTEIIPASETNKKLVTNGPFRFSRNPMYLGLVLASLGIALYAGTLPFYLVPVLVFVLCDVVVIPFEEAKMQRQFDGAYTDYRARVRRWV